MGCERSDAITHIQWAREVGYMRIRTSRISHPPNARFWLIHPNVGLRPVMWNEPKGRASECLLPVRVWSIWAICVERVQYPPGFGDFKHAVIVLGTCGVECKRYVVSEATISRQGRRKEIRSTAEARSDALGLESCRPVGKYLQIDV